MTRKEKIEIGKRIHDGEMTVKDAVDAFGVSRHTVWRWPKAYEQNPSQGARQWQYRLIIDAELIK